MENKLYLVYPYGYPEDYALVYGESGLMVVKQYCEFYGLDENITVNEFLEKYEVELISSICGKEIDKITFK